MASNNASLPTWLKPETITSALGRETVPDEHELGAILDKSIALEPLDMAEISALLHARKPEDYLRITGTADLVRQKVYGNRIVLTAPLHIDNRCDSECLYCACRRGNGQIQRRRLNPAEVREAGLKLIRQGHKRVVLVSSHARPEDIEYIAGICATLRKLSDGRGEIRLVNLDIGNIGPEGYAILNQAEPGTVNIFQETYFERNYREAHPSGPKSDFLARLEGPEIALQNGMEDIGLGLALGLGPWDFDVIALAAHVGWISQEYGNGGRIVNLHRVIPAAGCDYQPPFAMNDEEFIRVTAIVRLAIPHAGIVLATREPANQWLAGCNSGASQLLTGSLANPYQNWADAPMEKMPFPVGEETHLEEVVRSLLTGTGLLPSFCTACPRLGRSGGEFTSLAQSGDIKSQCGPNSLASFLEFILNYATPWTRELGEKLIAGHLAGMDGHERGAAEKLLQKVRSGRVDEFI